MIYKQRQFKVKYNKLGFCFKVANLKLSSFKMLSF